MLKYLWTKCRTWTCSAITIIVIIIITCVVVVIIIYVRVVCSKTLYACIFAITTTILCRISYFGFFVDETEWERLKLSSQGRIRRVESGSSFFSLQKPCHATIWRQPKRIRNMKRRRDWSSYRRRDLFIIGNAVDIIISISLHFLSAFAFILGLHLLFRNYVRTAYFRTE